MNQTQRVRAIRVAMRAQGGAATIRELGLATGIDVTTLHVDLRLMELSNYVRREEIKGWRANRGTGQNQFRWSIA